MEQTAWAEVRPLQYLPYCREQTAWAEVWPLQYGRYCREPILWGALVDRTACAEMLSLQYSRYCREPPCQRESRSIQILSKREDATNRLVSGSSEESCQNFRKMLEQKYGPCCMFDTAGSTCCGGGCGANGVGRSMAPAVWVMLQGAHPAWGACRPNGLRRNAFPAVLAMLQGTTM